MAGDRVFQFGDFTFDSGTRQLQRGGSAVHLSPKAFVLLQALLEAAPRALSKNDLQDRLWPDTFVVEANLQHLVAEVRRALDDDPRAARFVRTVFGFGYAFQEMPQAPAPARQPALCRLWWDDGRALLAEGEYTIGRDAAADVVLGSATVSRIHARLRVSDGSVVVEDLGSKNGTFVGDHRVDGSVAVHDGDGLRFGSVAVAIRIGRGADVTDTVVDAAPLRTG